MFAAVVNRLDKQCTMPWPVAIAGAQSQGTGASCARRSKVQLEQGITSGAILLVQLSPSLSLTGATLIIYAHNSNTNTQATLASLHMSTHANTSSTSTCLHVLVQVYYGHKLLLEQAVTHVLCQQ